MNSSSRNVSKVDEMRLMRRRAFDFQTCGLCQHTFPAPESNVPRTRTLRDFLVDPARDDTIRSFLESGHDKPTRTALVDFPGQTFAIAYCFDGYNTSDQLPVCEACISHLDRKAAPRIPPCCIKACDVSDPLPPGLVPPSDLSYVELVLVGIVLHSRFTVTIGDMSGGNETPNMCQKFCRNHFVVSPAVDPYDVVGGPDAQLQRARSGAHHRRRPCHRKGRG